MRNHRVRYAARIGLFLLSAALVLIGGGCVGSGVGRGAASIDIRLSPPNRIEINGADVGAESLGRKLRTMRANRHTRITIHIPRTMETSLALELQKHLVKLGYPKIVFARQLQPQVEADSMKK